jgi:hypothetical protein
MFLTKFNATSGAVAARFPKQLGATGKDTSGLSVATDANGNVYVSGNTTDNLGSNFLVGNSDFFLIKYNVDGSVGYTRQLGVPGGTANTSGNAVATYPDGNVFVAGDTTGNLDGTHLTVTQDLFLTKYDAGGIKQ